MNSSSLVKALQIINQSRQEKLNSIVEILSDLPDDFDWDELDNLTSNQSRDSD